MVTRLFLFKDDFEILIFESIQQIKSDNFA
jgi:hypothetical protein